MVQTMYLISSEIIIIVSCNKRTVEPALALTLPLVVVTDLREIHDEKYCTRAHREPLSLVFSPSSSIDFGGFAERCFFFVVALFFRCVLASL